MGMFDELILECPKCRKGKLEWQSKAGPCNLIAYTLETMPPIVAGDLDGETAKCDGITCDFVGTLRVQTLVRVE